MYAVRNLISWTIEVCRCGTNTDYEEVVFQDNLTKSMGGNYLLFQSLRHVQLILSLKIIAEEMFADQSICYKIHIICRGANFLAELVKKKFVSCCYQS